MARYDEAPVPRGVSSRWEVVLADEQEEHAPTPERTARDVRADHRILQGFGDDELRAVPLVPEGERLARFAEYLDLHDPARANFLAEGTEIVKPGQRVVARKAVAEGIWDDLRAACDDVTGQRRRRTA